ncbi:MAG: Phosphoglycolate phosphatase [Elusimicrobia bacterium]|nr:Phosphoglycolate phosphatase [Elusimicrobiota bacterium]
MTRAVIFDLDDTLYLERDFVFSGYKAVAEYFFQEKSMDIFPELKTRFEKGERGDLFTQVIKAHGAKVDEGYIKKLVHIYREHHPVIELFPEVRDVLTDMRKRYPLGLVSDGHLSVQKRKFEALNLEGFFGAVVFTDAFGREFWKPHTRGFEECLRGLNVSATDAVYVGDNPAKDFTAPKRLNMKTVRVRREKGLHTSLVSQSGEEPDMEIFSLNELQDVLTRWTERATV